ncbi:MAG: aspartate dehydrogenase [Burkholderiales bacterium]
MRLALIGCGAIGSAALELLRGDAWVLVDQVIVPEFALTDARAVCARLAPQARVATRLDLDATPPDLIAECAGHAAVAEHVLPALARGFAAVVASIGALSDAALWESLNDAAQKGGARVQLIAGAIGAIDALAAARLGGLDAVEYIGRKPPSGWRGTPAEAVVDLDRLSAPATIFSGTARAAARTYPKNANVAATVSLAGLGLDATQATLIADPGVTQNVHRVIASGAFGRLELTLENHPLAANPKTSALTVYSLVRAIRGAMPGVSI